MPMTEVPKPGEIKWDNAITADQQARVLVTILNAEIAVLRKRMIEFEAQLNGLREAVRRHQEVMH